MLEGLPPNNAAHRVRLVTDEVTARAVADIIVETFDPAETAAAAFEDESDPGRRKPWTVEVFFGRPPDRDGLRALVQTVAGSAAAEALVFDDVAERDWVAASLEGLGAVRAGRFVLHGRHDRARMRRHDIAIEIEAALAFGTGTGVLAIAAARALRQPVSASDIDPVAVAVAAANGRANGATPWLRPVVARGTQHPALQAKAPYDLILANILARPLRRLAPPLARAAAEGAELILSGLLVADVPGILSSYAAQGFALRRRIVLEGWATLLLR